MNQSKRFLRRLGLSLCLLLCLLWFALPVLATEGTFTPHYARSLTNNLRIRDGASTGASIQDYLMKDELVWVVGEQYYGNARMYSIQYINTQNTRVAGWVVCSEGNDEYVRDLTTDEVGKLTVTEGALPAKSGGTSASGSGSSSGSSSGGSSGTSSSKYSNTYIKLGDKNNIVKDMQQKLKDLGFYTGDITGSVGTRTVEAIKAFQKKKGLTADGVAGPATLNAIFGITDSSSSGSSSSGSSTGTTSGGEGDMGYTTADKVHLRAGPSTSDKSKSLLTSNSVFTILDKSKRGEYYWYHVQVSGAGTKGYIRGDMMQIMTAAEVEAYRNGQKPGVTAAPTATAAPNTTPAPGTTATPTPAPTSGGVTSGLARITASNVNVRSGADTASVSYGKATRNEVYNIGNSMIVSNVTWYHLESAKLSGWVHGNYVHLMSQAEIDEYNKTNSGTGSSGGSTSGGATTYRLLKYGSKGDDVKNLQQALKDKNFYSGNVTGNYGTKTEDAVKSFQRQNSLYVDGIAGQNTQAKIYGTGGSNPSAVETPSIGGVEMMDWSLFKSTINYPDGAKSVVTDVRSGKSFNIVKQSSGNHLDVEPATANDTAIMLQIYGGKIDYKRRPVWVTIPTTGGTRTFAGSMYGVAHGADTVANNDFEGQFCIHMKGSKNHVAGAVDADHQAAVLEAYNAAANKL